MLLRRKRQYVFLRFDRFLRKVFLNKQALISNIIYIARIRYNINRYGIKLINYCRFMWYNRLYN